ncbi:hypothetical protein Tco_0797592 [Tanacetum coccineum]
MLTSTGVKSSTSASKSQPSGNTMNNRISQSSSSNKTNKVEDQSRSVKSRKIKKNRVAKTECNAYVMQSMLNANSKPVCAICNECLFDANHDKWKPTGRTFTLVSNSCPLTRINSTKVVHLKETTSKLAETQKLEINVYSRKPKPIKSVGSSSKSTIEKSRITNTMEPDKSWGSNASDVPSSSSLVDFSEDLGKLQPKADIRIFVGYAPAKKAFRIYNRRTRLIIETNHVTFDELTAMDSEQFNSGHGPQLMTPATLSSGLVPNLSSPTPSVPPTKKDWEILFQLMFDEYFSPLTSVASTVLAAFAPVPTDSTSTPSSTLVDQDAPSPSTS